MMDDIANYCFHFYRSQQMLDFREIGGNYDIMLILRGVLLSIQPSVATRKLIQMPRYGVL